MSLALPIVARSETGQSFEMHLSGLVLAAYNAPARMICRRVEALSARPQAGEVAQVGNSLRAATGPPLHLRLHWIRGRVRETGRRRGCTGIVGDCKSQLGG